jgi:hypothetical protein
LSVQTEAASKAPSPPGTKLIVRSSVESMKLTNTPVGEAVSPRDRMRTQTVVVSIRTIASWKSALRRMRRALRASSGSA